MINYLIFILGSILYNISCKEDIDWEYSNNTKLITDINGYPTNKTKLLDIWESDPNFSKLIKKPLIYKFEIYEEIDLFGGGYINKKLIGYEDLKKNIEEKIVIWLFIDPNDENSYKNVEKIFNLEIEYNKFLIIGIYITKELKKITSYSISSNNRTLSFYIQKSFFEVEQKNIANKFNYIIDDIFLRFFKSFNLNKIPGIFVTNNGYILNGIEGLINQDYLSLLKNEYLVFDILDSKNNTTKGGNLIIKKSNLLYNNVEIDENVSKFYKQFLNKKLEKNTIIYIQAEWCAPSKAYTSLIIKLYKEKYQNQNFHFVIIDIGVQNPLLKSLEGIIYISPRINESYNNIYLNFRENFNIKGIPQLYLINQNNPDMFYDIRGISKSDVNDYIDQYI